jgi:hypothetical protein
MCCCCIEEVEYDDDEAVYVAPKSAKSKTD